MTITTLTSRELNQDVGRAKRAAQSGPVFITDRGRPAHVLMTIAEYRRLTGVGTVVNTSFNMHEEPIVCTPQDAVRSFMRGHLDYLAIGPFLVENPQLGPVVGQPPRRV